MRKSVSMDVILRTDINIVAVIMLGTVCLIACRRLDMKDRLNKVFLGTSGIIILEMTFETATCFLNRQSEAWIHPVSVMLHMMLFITGPILAYFWYRMLGIWISPEEKLALPKKILMLTPVVLNLVLTILSPLNGLIFSIDSANVYHRGPLFILSAAIVYFYFVRAFVMIWQQRKKVVKEEFLPLVAVGILPIIGGILQTLYYGLLLIWSSAGFSLIFVYIFLQQRMIHIDDLTGAWTRGTFEYCIAQKAKRRNECGFGLILIDIDGLKMINDQFGHNEGDYALKTVVQLIKSVLRKTDIIARTGGDEFLVIADCDTMEDIQSTISRIKSALKLHNETSGKDYLLDCSIGAEMYHSGFQDIEELMHHVDMLMYENKKIKKCS